MLKLLNTFLFPSNCLDLYHIKREMARNKQYNEQEDRKSDVFVLAQWVSKYLGTYVEKEMGINQFSIYASFGNKHGVFVESLKCYKTKIYSIFEKLQNGKDGVNDISVFYDSVRMPSELGTIKVVY
jgi:hypothetical protein